MQTLQPFNKSKITFSAAIIAGCAILFSVAKLINIKKDAMI